MSVAYLGCLALLWDLDYRPGKLRSLLNSCGTAFLYAEAVGGMFSEYAP